MIQLELNDRQAYLLAKSIETFKATLEQDAAEMKMSNEKAADEYPTPQFTSQGISFIQEAINELEGLLKLIRA